MKHFLLLLIFICACTSKKGVNYNQRENGHYELYSSPKNNFKSDLPTNLKRVLIVATNDLNGEIGTKEETITKNQKIHTYRVGGIEFIEQYFKTMQNLFAEEMLLIDAGNSFHGFNSNNIDGYKKVQEFFNKLNYSALSLSKFDFKLDDSAQASQNLLIKLIKESKSPYILSNLISITTGDFVNWTNTKPNLIKEINGIKVGIIATISPNLINALPENTFDRLYIEPIETSILKQSRALKNKGAQIIIAIINTKQDCTSQLAKDLKLPIDKVNFVPTSLNACNMSDELTKVLMKLPRNTIHGVIAGDTGSKIANFINDIPVISSFSGGSYFSTLEIFYDSANDKVLTESSIPHQPIKFCHEFIRQTQDCYINDLSVDVSEKSPAIFLGSEINSQLSAK